MKTLLSILLTTTILIAGPLSALSWVADKAKDLLINDKQSKTITHTKGKELNYDTVGKAGKVALAAYALISIEGYAKEIEKEISSAKDNDKTTYTPLMCGDKVVPKSFDQCPNKEDKIRYGTPIEL